MTKTYAKGEKVPLYENRSSIEPSQKISIYEVPITRNVDFNSIAQRVSARTTLKVKHWVKKNTPKLVLKVINSFMCTLI